MLKEIGVGLTLGNQKQVIMVFFQRKLVPTYISGLSVLTFIFYLMCRRKRYIEWLTSDRIDPPVLPCIQYLGLIFIFGLFFIFTLLISEMWAVSTKTQGFAFGVNFLVKNDTISSNYNSEVSKSEMQEYTKSGDW